MWVLAKQLRVDGYSAEFVLEVPLPPLHGARPPPCDPDKEHQQRNDADDNSDEQGESRNDRREGDGRESRKEQRRVRPPRPVKIASAGLARAEWH
jgi:hypothetical protein